MRQQDGLPAPTTSPLISRPKAKCRDDGFPITDGVSTETDEGEARKDQQDDCSQHEAPTAVLQRYSRRLLGLPRHWFGPHSKQRTPG